MVLGQPVLEARGQQVGLVSVAGEEVEGHGISSGERITSLSFSPLRRPASMTSWGFLQQALQAVECPAGPFRGSDPGWSTGSSTATNSRRWAARRAGWSSGTSV
jgi:hypothetical protein